MSKSKSERPERLAWGFRFAALLAALPMEFVVSSYTHDTAWNDHWGIALVVVSVIFAIVGTFGFIVVLYLWGRREHRRAAFAALCVVGCMAWSWWQLSGAFAAGHAEHEAAAFRQTEEYAFADRSLKAANAAIEELAAEEKAINIGAIVGAAQATLDIDKQTRDTERQRLKAERAKLFSFAASADPETQGDAIAAAQRRLRGIDAELARLLDTEIVAEPFKAAEVEIEARKKGIASRRATAKKDRAEYLPVVQRGIASANPARLPEHMGIAALILVLIAAIGSGFDLPARTGAETNRINKLKARLEDKIAAQGEKSNVQRLRPKAA